LLLRTSRRARSPRAEGLWYALRATDEHARAADPICRPSMRALMTAVLLLILRQVAAGRLRPLRSRIRATSGRPPQLPSRGRVSKRQALPASELRALRILSKESSHRMRSK